VTTGRALRSGTFARLRAELDRLIGELGREPATAVGVWQPAVDVIDDGDAYRVEVELPGVAPHEVEVELVGRCLVVRGSRSGHPEVAAARRFHLMERPLGSFEVAVTLDEPMRPEGARAVLSRGVLTVTLPRLAERRGRPVSIPVEETQEETHGG